MKGRSSRPIRCAIYTRKSTEHGLDLEFTSLDAQREACEAYVKSQAHEGWTAVPDRYDDAAYSGGTLERPALKRLLDDIGKGKVDIIVVYKIDRLTRSLSDFARLVDLFDAKSVSFVAITQQFNTTTSMGRLTLNILLSFAQFERELSSERVRDKVAASRRKGKWTGGTVPLGYDARNKKLVVNPAEAKQIRYIFQRYLELGTIRLLEDDLRARNIHSKHRTSSKKQYAGGIPLTYGPLAHLLNNRVYLGEIGHGGKWFAGEHKSIVTRELFDRVQQQLDAHRITRKARRTANGALLTGRIFDDRGNRMTPTYSTKKGVRYSFYVSAAVIRKSDRKSGSIGRVSASELEDAVIKGLKDHLPQQAGNADVGSLITTHIAQVVVSKDQLRIEFVPSASEDRSAGIDLNASGKSQATHIIVPWSPAPKRQLIEIDEGSAPNGTKPDPILVQAIVRAHSWLRQLSDGTYLAIEQLAADSGVHPKFLRQAIRLAFLSPKVTALVLDGEQPKSMSLGMWNDAALLSWVEQQKLVNRGGGYRPPPAVL